MKAGKLLKIAMLGAVLMLPCLLFAAPVSQTKEKGRLFQRVGIRIEIATKSPVPSTLNGKIRTFRLTNSWLLIFIDYTPQGKNQWLDDVELDMEVLIPDDAKKAKSSYVVFSGKIPFRFVLMDGRTRTAVMAIPPHFLERYLPRMRKLTAAAVNIRAVFRDSKGRELGIGYYPSRSEKDSKEFFEKILKKPTTYTVEDSVLPREETPWQFMNYDQSDLVRTRQNK